MARKKEKTKQENTPSSMGKKLIKYSRSITVVAVIIILLGAIFIYSRLWQKESVNNSLLPEGDISLPIFDEREKQEANKEVNATKITIVEGDKATIDYLGRLEDGTVFDTSNEAFAKKYDIYSDDKQYGALTVTVGKGQLIKGFDKGIIGMKLYEQKRIKVRPEDGYGAYDPAKIKTVSRKKEIDRNKELELNFNITIEQFVSVFKKEPVRND